MSAASRDVAIFDEDARARSLMDRCEFVTAGVTMAASLFVDSSGQFAPDEPLVQTAPSGHEAAELIR